MAKSKPNLKPDRLGLRVFLTAVILAAVFLANAALGPYSVLETGIAAGAQLDPSGNAFISSQYGMRFFSSLHVPLFVSLGLLIWVWWKPAKQVILAAGVLMLILSAMPEQVSAYYNKSNYAEPYFILPNETAYWIPDVGDNKTSQTQFKSSAYYDEKKVSAKRFDIPHALLTNSGLFSDFYVPAGRLIVVDLAPYSREWVKSQTRGTSAKDESFPCQSTEGINITLEISIGVSIQEQDSSIYLAHFGIEAIGDRTDPNVLFTSVLHARRLNTVMDTVGRNKVQALMCNEMTTRGFDDANAHAFDAMQSAKDKTEKYLKSVGITLEYLGWAGTMEFDKDVQQAINDRYTAEKLRPVLDVMRTQTALAVSQEAARKWNGQIPNVSGLWMVPSDLYGAIASWLSSPSTAKAPAPK